MLPRFLALALLSAFPAGLFAADPPPVRVMPLGDSITLGYSVPTYLSGYRDLLYALLTDAGYSIDYVGTLVDTQNPNIPDPDHEGHGGYRIDQIDAGIQGWLNAVQSPDVILLTIGTNDFWQNYQPATASTRLEALVGHIVALRPYATVLLATIVPRTDSASLEAAQAAFNATIPGIVNRQLSTGNRVYFVDLHRGLNGSDLSSDGVHPNQSGYDKMAGVWLPSIVHALAPGNDVLVNGSFESDLAGWSPTGNVTTLASAPPYQATEGTKLALFNGGQTAPNGTLTQSFTTTVGETYVLQFEVGALGYNTNQQRLLVSVQGNTTRVSQVIALSAPGGGGTRWAKATFPFSADSATTMLTFLDVSTTSNSVDLLLDQVQVRPRALRTLTFASSPTSGVNIAVSPADHNGNAGAATGFVRTYDDGTVVSLVAPSSAGGLAFSKWQVDGSDFGTQPAIDLGMDADHTATAVYATSAPVITSQPSNLTANVNAPVEFSVGATGSSLTYQWLFNGVNIVGATDSVYAIPAVQPSDGGQYSVIVSGAGGSVTSATAVLTAIASGTIANASFESDFTAWTANGHLSIVSDGSYQTTDGTHVAVFNGGQSTPDGTLSQRFATVAGRSYTLTFDLGAYAFNTNEQRIAVTVQGNATLLSQTVSIFGLDGGTTHWTTASYAFVADGSTASIVFKDVSATSKNLDLLLDHVRIDEPVARTLTIASSPDSGVGIAVSPADNNGAADGSTSFTRVYAQGASITLTAPASAGGHVFQKWQRDGVDFGTNPALTVSVDSDRTFTAVYAVVDAFANGSFESDFSAWIANGHLLIVSDGSYQATDGTHVVVFNGGQSTPDGTLSQRFATVAGRSYTLTFDLGAYAFNTNEQRIAVTVQGIATLLSQTVSIFGLDGGTTHWTTASYTFVADGSTASIVFKDVSATSKNLDLLLDHVRVDEPVARTLTIASSPDSGVGIAVSPADNNGTANGSTGFTCVYTQGTTVTLTAPASAGGSVFQKWQRDGVDFGTNPTLTFSVDGDRTLTAVYAEVDEPVDFTLTIASSPDSGVGIAVSPADNNGAADGSTSFTRVYAQGTSVTLTAPASAGGHVFQKWQRDGVDLGTNLALTVPVDGDRALTAVYAVVDAFANGSFESDYAGWTASGNQVIVSGAPYSATDGAKLLVFNGGQTAPNGTVAQSFATTPGQVYSLLFDVGVLAYNTQTQRLQVTVTGTAALLSQTISLTGLGGGRVSWSGKSYTFTADSTATNLRFTDVSSTTQNLDLLLDNVRVAP